jgi:NitT/TauT family transport system substrate-binding protein
MPSLCTSLGIPAGESRRIPGRGSAPETLAAFLRALRQGQEIADTDRGAVEQAMEAHRRSDGVQPAIAAVMTLDTYPLAIDPVRLQRVPNIMFQFGLLPRRFSIREMLS